MQTKSTGFTLVEVLIVVAIVAILAAIAYPSYQNHISRTRYADAKVMLMQVMQAQRKYFTDNNSYTTDLIGDLGYADAGAGKVSTEGDFYLLSASECSEGESLTECVLLTAEASFNGPGNADMSYNSRNEKSGPDKAW